LLNPDVRVEPGTLSNALCFLKSHPDAAAVGACQIGGDGRIQASVRGFPSPDVVLYDFIGLSKLFPRSRVFAKYRMGWFDYNKAAEVDQPMATFLLIPRTAYQEVGGFDTDFPIFFNDVDWCFRAKSAGWRIYYTPQARITHYGGSGTGLAPRASMVLESHRSLVRFWEKHNAGRLSAGMLTVIKAGVMAGAYLRCLGARRNTSPR
jgi:GT2 family glycosyltransferase